MDTAPTPRHQGCTHRHVVAECDVTETWPATYDGTTRTWAHQPAPHPTTAQRRYIATYCTECGRDLDDDTHATDDPHQPHPDAGSALEASAAPPTGHHPDPHHPVPLRRLTSSHLPGTITHMETPHTTCPECGTADSIVAEYDVTETWPAAYDAATDTWRHLPATRPLTAQRSFEVLYCTECGVELYSAKHAADDPHEPNPNAVPNAAP